MITRRKFLGSAGAIAGGAALLSKLNAADEGVKTREPDKPRETTAAARKGKPLMSGSTRSRPIRQARPVAITIP